MSLKTNNLKDAKALRKALSDLRLINEIHFLLWRPPFQNKANQWDSGLMCREHALVAASLGALLGLPAYQAWGKVVLVGDIEGPPKRQILRTDPHSWAMFEDIGLCDLSVKLHEEKGTRWKPWPISVLVLGHPQVHLDMYGHNESKEWEKAINAACQASGFHILYLGESFERLSVRYLKE